MLLIKFLVFLVIYRTAKYFYKIFLFEIILQF